MITSGSLPWLHSTYEADRRDALRDSSGVSDAELERLGVSRVAGGGVNDPETYLIDNTPVDPETGSQEDAINVKEIPGHD